MTRASLSFLLVSGLTFLTLACSDNAATPDAAPPPPPDAFVEPDAPENPCYLKPDGTQCGDQTDGDCDHPDMCVSGYCYANFEIAGRACGDSTDSECDRPDTCDGSGVCSPNRVLAGTLCGGPPDECSMQASCNGEGACEGPYLPAGTPCGGDPAECSEQASCDGAGTCEASYSAVGTPCGDLSDTTCTNPDHCDGAGLCLSNDESDGLYCNDCSGGPGQCTSCLDGICANICQPGTLLTTLIAGNGSAGNIFDVRAINDVEIRAFDANLDSGTHTVEIYYRPGPYLGFENSSAGWTLLGNVSVMSLGENVATPVPIDVQVVIPAGQTYAFYVTTTSAGINYTNGTSVGSVYASDSNIEFLEGVGKTYPFGSTYTPRIFNGNIHYDVPPCDGVPMVDAGVPDASIVDASVPDADPADAGGLPDADPADAGGLPDASTVDAAPLPDASPADSGGLPDASTVDASVPDASTVDAAPLPDSSGLPDALTTD